MTKKHGGKHGGKRAGAGRPRGRVSKAKLDIAERAKTHGETALQTLLNVMTDSEAPAAAKVSAANAMLDRGYGRPMQAVEHSGPDGGPIETKGDAVDKIAGILAGIAAREGTADGSGGADT